MNSPRLWRRPIARLSINEAPIRIGSAGLRACSLDTRSPLAARGSVARYPKVAGEVNRSVYIPHRTRVIDLGVSELEAVVLGTI